MNKQITSLILAASFFPSIASGFGGFPEFSFCPLGGPPGWVNRLTGQYDVRQYPQPYSTYLAYADGFVTNQWYPDQLYTNPVRSNYPMLFRQFPAYNRSHNTATYGYQ